MTLLAHVLIKCPETQDGHVLPAGLSGLGVHQANNDAELTVCKVPAQARTGRRSSPGLDPDEVIVDEFVRVEPLEKIYIVFLAHNSAFVVAPCHNVLQVLVLHGY